MTIKKLVNKCVDHILDEGAPVRALSDAHVQNQPPKYGPSLSTATCTESDT
ncbi:hypothetical protein [Pseudoalteromonas sp. A757]|uniref:hypothetical protein n=1 Tax=Pseudoalteromonas sp. A757 TaxID=2250709 RepID=UPI001F0080E4|nr:hypothetical protein [Pseudoalteromonas sp. A757]